LLRLLEHRLLVSESHGASLLGLQELLLRHTTREASHLRWHKASLLRHHHGLSEWVESRLLHLLIVHPVH
jgi:hypothetical protein